MTSQVCIAVFWAEFAVLLLRSITENIIFQRRHQESQVKIYLILCRNLRQLNSLKVGVTTADFVFKFRLLLSEDRRSMSCIDEQFFLSYFIYSVDFFKVNRWFGRFVPFGILLLPVTTQHWGHTIQKGSNILFNYSFLGNALAGISSNVIYQQVLPWHFWLCLADLLGLAVSRTTSRKRHWNIDAQIFPAENFNLKHKNHAFHSANEKS